jgi:heme exporter protein D
MNDVPFPVAFGIAAVVVWSAVNLVVIVLVWLYNQDRRRKKRK